MKTLAPLLLLVLLAGCASRPAPTAPNSASAQATVTVTGDPAGAATDFMGGEIHCHIQSIDGDPVSDTARLSPGRHSIIAVLNSQDQVYIGVIQIGVPDARPYRIRAHRREDAVTVTLVGECDRLIATATAPLAAQMKFDVFVKQK